MYPMFRAGVRRVQHPAAAQHHAGQGGAGRGQEPPCHRGHWPGLAGPLHPPPLPTPCLHPGARALDISAIQEDLQVLPWPALLPALKFYILSYWEAAIHCYTPYFADLLGLNCLWYYDIFSWDFHIHLFMKCRSCFGLNNIMSESEIGIKPTENVWSMRVTCNNTQLCAWNKIWWHALPLVNMWSLLDAVTWYSLSLPQGVGVGLAQARWLLTWNLGTPFLAFRSHLV